jgi:hypothetical protein
VPLSPIVRVAFLTELHTQARYAMRALQEISASLADHVSDPDRLWFAVHGFLSAAANVSKILWPTVAEARLNSKRADVSGPERARKARGDELREILLVSEDSPLRSRDFRNHFEHFDERLEDWALSPRHNLWADENVFNGYSDTDPELRVQLRAVNVSTGSLIFRGGAHPIGPVAKALANLMSRIHEIDAVHSTAT